MSLHLLVGAVVGAWLSVLEVDWGVGKAIAPWRALRAIARYDVYQSAALEK